MIFAVILQKSTLSTANKSKPILVLHKEDLLCTRKKQFLRLKYGLSAQSPVEADEDRQASQLIT